MRTKIHSAIGKIFISMFFSGCALYSHYYSHPWFNPSNRRAINIINNSKFSHVNLSNVQKSFEWVDGKIELVQGENQILEGLKMGSGDSAFFNKEGVLIGVRTARKFSYMMVEYEGYGNFCIKDRKAFADLSFPSHEAHKKSPVDAHCS